MTTDARPARGLKTARKTVIIAMQHPPVLRQTPSPEHSSGTRLGSRNRPAHRPPRLDFSNQTTCSGFVPTASVSSPSPQAIRLAMDVRTSSVCSAVALAICLPEFAVSARGGVSHKHNIQSVRSQRFHYLLPHTKQWRYHWHRLLYYSSCYYHVFLIDCNGLCLVQVEVNTRVQTDHFTGEARYMQLTVYVDKTCIPSLKQFQFVK